MFKTAEPFHLTIEIYYSLLNAKRGGLFIKKPAGRESYSTPKWWATPLAIVNPVHCRRGRRRDLLVNSERLPT
ncbi:MAG: hypothetical protein LBK82_17480 [Planctomycetaceae bacterium]|nr:hypothetical protein [Planctomycetaceae bacterium]